MSNGEGGDVYVMRKRIYGGLFPEDNGAQNADELRGALAQFIPQSLGSEAPTNEVLRRLNGGDEPGFDVGQIATMQTLFDPPRAMSPSQPDAAAAALARRFWRGLIFGPNNLIDDLWPALHRHDAEKSQESYDAVIARLDAIVPGAAWTAEHVADLVVISVGQVSYSNLVWRDIANDIW